MDERSAWRQEWCVLQADHERHEWAALVVKLAAMLGFLLGAAWDVSSTALALLLGLLWLQEAIGRTVQARLGRRILTVEAALASAPSAAGAPFQLHTEWLAQRPGLSGLLAEYLASALRPTVAFPHAALLLGVAWLTLMD